MFPWFARAAVTVLLAPMLIGCEKSGRVDQCNAFVERANVSQAVVEILKFDGDAQQLEEEAKKVDSEVQWVNGVELTDATLMKFRADYAANLQRLAASIRDLAKLRGSYEKADLLKKIADGADSPLAAQSKLVHEINSYCGAR
jgi:hypothetical protein